MRSLMRAVSRAADYTLKTMKMVRVTETEGRNQSRRLHPLPSEHSRSSMTSSTQNDAEGEGDDVHEDDG